MTHSLAALLLLLFLLLVMPVWGWLDMRRLKRQGAAATRMQSYAVTIGVMWLLTLVSAWLVPAHALWVPPAGLATGMKLDVVPPGALIGVAVGLMIGLLAPVIMVRRTPGAAGKQLAPIRFLLPTTVAQRWMFALVCVTAGIAEEIVYRGFVLHVLVVVWPGTNGWWIVLAAAALFGIAHAYQGKAGTVATGVMGFLFSLFYIATGNLLLPMALHTLVDLRIFLLIPSEAGAGGTQGERRSCRRGRHFLAVFL